MPVAPTPTSSAVPSPADQELTILTDVGALLSSILELRDAFGKVMQIISDKLNMHRGTLVLLDESTGRLRTEAAVGLTDEEIARGKYALGEGITGNVVATGRPRVISDLRNEPDFLNRTGRLTPDSKNIAISYICVPIRIVGRTAGALAIDKPFVNDEQLRSDHTFLDIIAAFLAQAIQINRMVMRQKEELLEENAQLRAQVKLLRVVQERESERVGDTQTVKVDVRVIAATNVDLQEEVGRGTFREDLFYRLNVVSVYLPPLRNRREDIPRLIDYFLDKYNGMNERRLRRISRDMLNVLLRYPWPGNVRELENAIERAVVLSNDEDFTEDLLPLSVRMFAAQRRNSQASESIETLTKRLAEQSVADYELREGEIYQLVINQIERASIEQALGKCNNGKTKAAELLGSS